MDVTALDWARPDVFFDAQAPDERFDLVIAADSIWLIELVAPLVGALRVAALRNPGIEVPL